MKNISVLIKPASGACNMTCDYCFYCDEAAKGCLWDKCVFTGDLDGYF